MRIEDSDFTVVEQWGITGWMVESLGCVVIEARKFPRAGLGPLPGRLSTGPPEAPQGSEVARGASMIDGPATATFRKHRTCCCGIILYIKTESVWALERL